MVDAWVKMSGLGIFCTTDPNTEKVQKNIIRTKHNVQIFRVILFIKLQNDTKITIEKHGEKQWKMRWRAHPLICLWLSYIAMLFSCPVLGMVSKSTQGKVWSSGNCLLKVQTSGVAFRVSILNDETTLNPTKTWSVVGLGELSGCMI